MGAGAGRHEAEGRPWGADARGQEPGSGQGGRQEAAPASGSQGLPSCAAMGDATRGETGLGELSAGYAHTQAASSPAGARGPQPSSCHQPPERGRAASLHPQTLPRPLSWSRGKRRTCPAAGKMCWKEALKKETEPGAKTGPPLVSVSYRIKTSISAPARATSGRERREGWPAGSAPREHGRAMLLLPPSLPAALNTRAGRWGEERDWAAGQGEAGLVKCTSSSLLFTTNKYCQKKKKVNFFVLYKKSLIAASPMVSV